jgi:4-oxalomesaconate hydratase
MDGKKTVLVVSAHAADFVWRAGGTIALYAQRGYRVRILCLSFGERGESERLWRQPGITLEEVKRARQAESEKAAAILGAEIRFFDSGDYPMKPAEETVGEMVKEFREYQPEFLLTHSYADPYNPDHPEAAELSLRTRVYAQAAGSPYGGKKLGAPPVFMFEPHQPEQCDFKPQVLLDITPVFDLKRQAMESMEAQQHLWEYCTDLAKRRGVQAVRNSGRQEIKYAEAFQRVYPQVTSELS